eukprot:TRINITY_DN5019_c0_g1_i1.p1 TRINITY_DN5019_c0_g1~~TRINITY_DN5019_c0_g1_i1.p1  ORF type:complete len:659 (+),score=214.65 TRINITY_DN5019_c0_g1_i1:51-1979(+)
MAGSIQVPAAEGGEDDALLRPDKVFVAFEGSDGDAAHEDPPSAGFCRLMRMAGPEKHLVLLSLAFQITQTVGELAPPILAGAVVDALAATQHHAPLGSRPLPVQWLCDVGECGDEKQLTTTVVLGFLAVSLVTAVVTTLASATKRIAGSNLLARVRGDLFAAIMAQEAAFFDTTRSGELVSRITNDLDIVGNLLTYELTNRAGSMFRLAGSSLYIFFISWRLSLVMYGAIPLTSLVAKAFGDYFERLAAATQRALARATEVASESITAVRTVKSFSREDSRERLFRHRVNVSRECGVRMAYSRGYVRGLTTFLEACSQAAVLYVGAREVREGVMTTGELAAFILYAIKIGSDLQDCFGLWGSFKEALGSTSRVFELIDRQPRAPLRGNRTVADLKGLVEFRGVHFSYQNRSGAAVLRGLDLVLQPGAVTAVVGKSGAGKSTIASLLCGLYEPTAGTILLDGIQLADMDPVWLHSRVAVVSQEPVLLVGSIADNIAFGVRGEVTEDAIRGAAKAANADSFIASLPEGYRTDVGESGHLLSGGQKQRIAIARAILMDPRVLLLDEATSALDTESERLVAEALERLMAGRTVMVIAHRLATVRKASRIVVVRDGVVVEDGSHEQLQHRDGAYAALIRSQLLAPDT